MKRLLVGISGASGVVYGIRLLEILRGFPEVETHLVLSEGAVVTLKIETSHTAQEVAALADVVHDHSNLAASISSGSFQVCSMVVMPCSMKNLAQIALSLGDNLLARAADVTLKERRKLVIVPRETPLHLGHLRNMVALAEKGASSCRQPHPSTTDRKLSSTWWIRRSARCLTSSAFPTLCSSAGVSMAFENRWQTTDTRR